MFLDRVRLDAEDNPDESLRGAPGAAGAASRPWTEWSEGGVKCLCSGFGAVLDDERKVAGKRTYFTAVVVVFI
jgi:hypothetical protein